MSEKKETNKDLIARDAKYVLRPWSGGDPVPLVDGKGCVVTDADGKSYLDFTSGYFVNNAGHCHPQVMAAAAAQMQKITQVSGKLLTPAAVDLAERLVGLSPSSINKVFFATGGSEANENGLKMARQFTEKPHIATLDNGYHGLTLGALAACSSQKYRDTAFIPLDDTIYFLPVPYCYRCPHCDDCTLQCLDQAQEMLDRQPPAAIFCEAIQAVGGVIPPDKWWARMDEMRRERGILLFIDEVQTGIGRTGKFFAVEHYGLEPEIMTAGKGLSGAVGSLTVAMARQDVAEAYFGGTTPTSAANAVSAAAGLALIDVIEAEGLVDNCARMGERLTEEVARLDHPWVGDIRFRGLLGGVELVASRETKEILPKKQVAAVNDALQRDGVLITVSGLHGNVLRLQPPLCISADQIDEFVGILGRVLTEVRG